jgi:hypothetical protein
MGRMHLNGRETEKCSFSAEFEFQQRSTARDIEHEAMWARCITSAAQRREMQLN